MNADLLEVGLDELKHSPCLYIVLILRNGAIVLDRYFNGSDFHQSNNIHSASKSILSANFFDESESLFNNQNLHPNIDNIVNTAVLNLHGVPA